MNINYSQRTPADYIMHRGPMLLLDHIVSADTKTIEICSTIKRDNIFFDHALNGVPAWVGLEYMAQSAAVWVGMDDERQGKPIQLGFLLGSRSYETYRPVFGEGTKLYMKISTDFVNGSLIVFNGGITDENGAKLVDGNLTAFRPDDVDIYLQGKGKE